MKRPVFLITEYYRAEQNTTGYLLEKLCHALEKDAEIDLTLLVKEDLDFPKQSNTIYVKAGVKNKSSLIKRLMYELKLSFGFLFQSWKYVKKEHIVFTGTTPIFLLPIVAILKKIIGFKWVLLVHDVFPENLVPAKIVKPNHILYKVLKKVFDSIYSQAERVIVIGKDMQDLVYSKTHKNNIDIVQNWIDSSDIAMQKRLDNPILKEIGWSNTSDTIFYYFGNIGRMQGIDIILDAIPKMKMAHQAKFVFIGDGAYVDHLKERIQQMNNPNVIYYGRIAQENKSDGLNAGDVALVTLAEGMLGLGVPSKSYFTMAADKPILAIMDQQSEVVDMVEQHQVGWTTDIDLIKLADKLDHIVLQQHQYDFLNSPRLVLEQYYSEPVAMNKILNIIKTLRIG